MEHDFEHEPNTVRHNVKIKSAKNAIREFGCCRFGGDCKCYVPNGYYGNCLVKQEAEFIILQCPISTYENLKKEMEKKNVD